MIGSAVGRLPIARVFETAVCRLAASEVAIRTASPGMSVDAFPAASEELDGAIIRILCLELSG